MCNVRLHADDFPRCVPIYLRLMARVLATNGMSPWAPESSSATGQRRMSPWVTWTGRSMLHVTLSDLDNEPPIYMCCIDLKPTFVSLIEFILSKLLFLLAHITVASDARMAFRIFLGGEGDLCVGLSGETKGVRAGNVILKAHGDVDISCADVVEHCGNLLTALPFDQSFVHECVPSRWLFRIAFNIIYIYWFVNIAFQRRIFRYLFRLVDGQ